jgi:predicted AAA+ superfamily ATPase
VTACVSRRPGLCGELATALTGRHLTVELFPFDLDEVRDMRPVADLEAYLREGG